jgi:hypothetical protein
MEARRPLGLECRRASTAAARYNGAIVQGAFPDCKMYTHTLPRLLAQPLLRASSDGTKARAGFSIYVMDLSDGRHDSPRTLIFLHLAHLSPSVTAALLGVFNYSPTSAMMEKRLDEKRDQFLPYAQFN